MEEHRGDTNSKVTRGQVGKQHVDQYQGDTWIIRDMLHGLIHVEVGTWHIGQ